MLTIFPTIFTPQGDGNLQTALYTHTLAIRHSRQYLPRKGTETFFPASLSRFVCVKFPTIFTPQGDGNAIASKYCEASSGSKFPTIFTPQGDGNFPMCSSRQTLGTQGFPTIFTPQGDGNQLRTQLASNQADIPDNIYPARGRKLALRFSW